MHNTALVRARPSANSTRGAVSFAAEARGDLLGVTPMSADQEVMPSSIAETSRSQY